MKSFIHNFVHELRHHTKSEELKTTAIVLCLIFMVLTPPFFVVNILRETYGILFFLVLVYIGSLINLYTIRKKNRYYPAITFFFMYPCVVWFNVLLIFHLQTSGLLWSYVFLVSASFILPHAIAYLASIFYIFIVTVAAMQVFEFEIVLRFFLTLSVVYICLTTLVHIIYSKNKVLEIQATQDALTGALNRTTLTNVLSNSITIKQRSNVPASILCVDVDYFKAINDTLGHSEGDAVLVKLSAFFKKTLTPEQKFFRLGGEEFLVLLPNTTLKQACAIAESYRSQVAGLPLLSNEKKLTVSIGIAELSDKMSTNDWIKKADHAMYKAKNQGRNCVAC